MTDVIEWGGGEVWKLVEGGDVICNGEASHGARIKTFYVGHTMGGGEGGG